jgi:hypothetical protein
MVKQMDLFGPPKPNGLDIWADFKKRKTNEEELGELFNEPPPGKQRTKDSMDQPTRSQERGQDI